MKISNSVNNSSAYTKLNALGFIQGLGFLLLAFVLTSQSALAANDKNTLSLVGNKVPTLIDIPEYPSRAIPLVKAALADKAVNITATTQAWSGSGLRSGKFLGFIDHYSLNNERNNYIYSEPYMVLPLHIASKSNRKLDVTRLDLIYRKSVGVENRFANTDALRSERSVRWARSPDFVGLIQQLVDQRTDYILADKFMLDEVNKMLVAANEKPLFISSLPIQKVQLSLAINASQANAQEIITMFNQGIENLRTSGEYENYLSPDAEGVSLLDEALYEDIIRKW